MILKPNAKFWDVRFSEPASSNVGDKEYRYRKNIHGMVVAESADKVCELVKIHHPLATIHQINHRGGECAILVQPDMIKEENDGSQEKQVL